MQRRGAAQWLAALGAVRWRHIAIAALVALLLVELRLLVLFVCPDGLSGCTGASTTDFLAYRSAAERFVSDPGDLYLAREYRYFIGWLYPPPAVLLFVPFLSVPFLTGQTLFTLFGCVCLALGHVVLWRFLIGRGVKARPSDLALFVLLGVASGPAFNSAQWAQVPGLVLLSAALCVYWADRGRPVLSGLALAVGVWIKLYPALLLVYLLARRETRGSGLWGVGWIVGLPLLAAPWVPPDLYITCFGEVLPSVGGQIPWMVGSQSVLSFLERASVAPEIWHLAEGRTPLTGGHRVLVAGLALAASVWAWRLARSVDASRARLAALLLLAVLAPLSPLGWKHAYVLTTPLMAFFLVTDRSRWVQAVGGGMWLLLAVPSTQLRGVLDAAPVFVHYVFHGRYLLFAVAALGLLAWRCRAKDWDWDRVGRAGLRYSSSPRGLGASHDDPGAARA